MNKNNETRVYNCEFDFSFRVNDYVLIYREFNVKGYNDDFRESLEARELIDELLGVYHSTGLLINQVKKASVEALWESFNPYKVQSLKESTTKENSNRSDKYVFELRKKQGNGKEIILTHAFDGEMFQPKLRIKYDNKEEIIQIMDTIRDYMSRSSYSKVFCGTKLKRFNKITKRELNECR